MLSKDRERPRQLRLSGSVLSRDEAGGSRQLNALSSFSPASGLGISPDRGAPLFVISRVGVFTGKSRQLHPGIT